MSNSFSEREELIKSANLDPKEMPIELRNRLWNVTKDYIDKRLSNTGNDREAVIEHLWDKFFKQDKDNLKSRDNYYI